MSSDQESRSATLPGAELRAAPSAPASPVGAATERGRIRWGRAKRWIILLSALIVLAATAWGFYSAFRQVPVEPENPASSVAAKAPTPPIGEQTGAANPEPQDRPPLDPLIPETAAGLLEEAERVVADLARRFPKNPDAHEMGARFHFEFAAVDQAVVEWQRCLALNENYAYAHIGLAKAAAGRGEHAEAVAHCRHAILADPGRLSHQIDLGQALLNAGEIDESLEALGGVVKSAPGSARGHAELGAAQLQKRDFEAAKTSFESVLRLDPTYAPAHFGLATACARLGLVEQAREHEARFREFRSDRQQELRGARLAYDDVQALYVDIAQRYTEIAAVYLAEGRLAPAEQLWRRAARMHSENRECRQALAWLLLQQNKPWETILLLRELARLEPANLSYPAEIARLYGRLDRPDDAERTLQDFAQSSPDSAAGQTALADFYLNVKKVPALAVQHARKAVNISGAADHWYLLSVAQEVAGDLPAAVAALERAAQLAPENAQYRQLLALSKSRAAATDSGHPGKTIPASTETGVSKSDTAPGKAPNQRD